MSTSAPSVPSFPTWPEDATLREYVGSCHCAKIQYKFTHPVFEEGAYHVTICNCSICEARGFLGVYVPEARFEFTRGNFEELTAYEFSSKVIRHYFCPACGVACVSLAKPVNLLAVNARTVEGVELERLKLKPFNGKGLRALSTDHAGMKLQ